ncbi:MAG TPA: hypothetical protein VKN18_33015 [Blastocatellia bacterium]|nr:hypothetical protein [Blastocatellia bacterium]
MSCSTRHFSAPPAEPNESLTGFSARVFPAVAVTIACLLYAIHSFFGGGNEHRILDSWAYLQISDGQSAGVPFDIRVLVPWLAAHTAILSGLSVSAAYNLLTSLALLGSLLILKQLLTQRGSSWQWQTAVLLAFGCSLAVTFGYTPILVDPFLLLVTCLTIVALVKGKLVAALVLTCVAVLTKEFGLFLVPVWAFYTYRLGYRKSACVGLLAPIAIFVVVVLVRHSDAPAVFPGWKPYAYHYLFDYQLSVLRLRGLSSYLKLLYMGAWCGLWPTSLLAAMCILDRSIRSTAIGVYRIGLAVLLVSLPILLPGDWSRNLIVLVPFSSIVAAKHPLARDRYFIGLIAIGGLTTALARPFHGEPLPAALMISMTAFSLISSVMIAIKLVQYTFWSSRLEIDPLFEQTAGATID